MPFYNQRREFVRGEERRETIQEFNWQDKAIKFLEKVSLFSMLSENCEWEVLENYIFIF